MRSNPAGFLRVHRIAIFWVLASFFITSCTPSKLRPVAVFSLGSAEEAVAYFRSEEDKIRTYRGVGNIRPASGGKFTQMDLMVRLSSNRLSLAGLTPFGLPIFRIMEDENGISIHGLENLDSLNLSEENVRNEIGLLREVFNVYYMEGRVRDAVSLFENETYYILSRIRLTPGCFSDPPADQAACWGLPVRTYWVEKKTLNLVRKEIYGRNKQGKEEKILTVEYSDFRPVSLLNLPGEVLNVPFGIALKGKGGKPLGEVIFHEVHLDDEDSGT